MGRTRVGVIHNWCRVLCLLSLWFVAVLPVSAQIPSGGALFLDGDGDYVKFVEEIIRTKEFTVEAYAKMMGKGGGLLRQNPIFQQRDDSAGRFGYSTILLVAENISGVPLLAIRTQPNFLDELRAPRREYNEWHHYAAVVSLDSVSFFVDGDLIESISNNQPGNYNTSIDYIDIGRHRYSQEDQGFFFGLIDEVRVWDHALQALEIETLMHDTLSATYYTTQDSGLVGYWRFDEERTLHVDGAPVRSVLDLSTNRRKGLLVDDARIAPYDFVISDSIGVRVSGEVGFPGDTVSVSIDVSLPEDLASNAFEFTFHGFTEQLGFVGLDTRSTLTEAADWLVEFNSTDSLLQIASAGAVSIMGEGSLFRLIFLVEESAGHTVPVIAAATFDSGIFPVSVHQGYVRIINEMPGDVDLNGRVQAFDASLILKHVVGLAELNPAQIRNANVSDDTTISALDATLILRFTVALIDSLPFVEPGLFAASADVQFTDMGVHPGEEVGVKLDLLEASNLHSFSGYIDFETLDLEFADISWPEEVSILEFNENLDTGNLYFAAASTDTVKPSGNTLVIKFRVKPGFENDQTIILLRDLRLNENAPVDTAAVGRLFRLTVSVDEQGELVPTDFRVAQNYPNPFNPETVIQFQLPEAANVLVRVFDILGQEVLTIADREFQAGSHSVHWDGRNENSQLVSTGLYFYEVRAGNFREVMKMLFLQ